MENLKSCIEKSILTIDKREGFQPRYYEFYYDSRFGTEIDPAILHPAYKNCITSHASIVTKVKSVKRKENTFFVVIESDLTEQVIIVRFYNIDKTFVCRSFDPREVIPAILADPDCSEYLSSQGHPIGNFGYVANYSGYPNAVTKYTNKRESPEDSSVVGDSKVDLEYSRVWTETSPPDKYNEHWYKRFLENLSTQQSKNLTSDLTSTDIKKACLHESEYFEPDQKSHCSIDFENMYVVDDDGNWVGAGLDDTGLDDTDALNEPEQLDCDSCPVDDRREMTVDEIKEIEEMFNKPDDSQNDNTEGDYTESGAPFSHLPKKLKDPPKKILFRPDYESTDPVAVSSDELCQSSDLPPGFTYIRDHSPAIIEYIQEPDESAVPDPANINEVPDIYEEIRKAKEMRRVANIRAKLFDRDERFRPGSRMYNQPTPYGRPDCEQQSDMEKRLHEMRIRMIQARILLQKKLSEIPPMDPIDLYIIPKLEQRTDNIDDTSFSKDIILDKLDEYKVPIVLASVAPASLAVDSTAISTNCKTTEVETTEVETTEVETTEVETTEVETTEVETTPDFR